MRKLLLAGVAAAAIGGFALAPAAHAYTIGGAVSPPVPTWLLDLGTSPSAQFVGDANYTFSGVSITSTPGGGTLKSGVYAGSSASQYASPFGNPEPGAPPYNNYLVAEANSGSVTMSFTQQQNAFQLLWGTVDSDPTTYNQLQFAFSSGGGTPTIVNGADIASALGIAGNGTINAAVWIYGLPSFDTVTATATNVAFEFVPGTPVPEPGSLALLGTGLLGLGFLGWSMKKRNAA